LPYLNHFDAFYQGDFMQHNTMLLKQSKILITALFIAAFSVSSYAGYNYSQNSTNTAHNSATCPSAIRG
jgi:hypothetical protein